MELTYVSGEDKVTGRVKKSTLKSAMHAMLSIRGIKFRSSNVTPITSCCSTILCYIKHVIKHAHGAASEWREGGAALDILLLRKGRIKIEIYY